ncbi:hypothetical protein [Flavobacterium limi]|uniref:Uncharacterized protein n=1 Tax=Flavobacterium limi TaxID=2045105 RepID=A0ABQ1UMA3_9FLAO|nr:hypothetical protein [Flavobacterium limi]GGF21335.1 hypothetical protein GCM10011518_33150 [Flavobacterium limi]
MDNTAAIRISEREQAIKKWLKELIEEKGAKLPVMPETVYDALENINVSNAIKEFAPDITDLQNFINENNAQALVYEWFYDGGEVNNIHAYEGYAYRECIFDGKPGNTDLLSIDGHDGFEMEPELNEQINDSFGGFCLDPVMNVWYEKLAVEFSGKFNEYYDLNSKADIEVDLDTVTSAYDELFHLKLITLIRQAHQKALEANPIKIDTGKSFHLFIKRHERWPMHVLSLNV